MAREYGKDLTAKVIARMTEQEKDRVKEAAAARALSISELIRQALEYYLEENE